MTVEIVGPPSLGSIHLAPGNARWRSIRVSRVEEVFEAVVNTARRMVADPWGVFRGTAGKCCRCRRRLTDIISRTRGIGPECIQRFAHFGALRHQDDQAQARIHSTYSIEPVPCDLDVIGVDVGAAIGSFPTKE